MSPEEKLALLHPIPVFAALDRAALRALAGDADMVELVPGQVLFRAGDASDGGYVVAGGSLELTPEEPGAAVRQVAAGALVGEMTLLVNLPRSALALATEPTQLLHVRRSHLLKILEGRPQSALRLKELFARRLDTFLGELDQVRRELEHFRPSSRR